MSLRLHSILLAALLLAGASSIAHAGNPFEWALRTNGWSWGEGYHAYSNCQKTGRGQYSYAPIYDAYSPAQYSYPVQSSTGYPLPQSPKVMPHSPGYPNPQPIESLPSIRKQVPPVPPMPTRPEAYRYPNPPQMNAPYAPERAAFRPTSVRP